MDPGLQVLENFETLACKDSETKVGVNHEVQQP